MDNLKYYPPMDRRPLTSMEKEAAESLKAIWDKRKEFLRKAKKQKLTQEVAEEYLGISQGAISHYLTGKIPLNLAIATKFAKLLDCKLIDISPMFDLNSVAPPTPHEIQSTGEMLKLAFDCVKKICLENKLSYDDGRLIELAALVYEEALEINEYVSRGVMKTVAKLTLQKKNIIS